MPRSKNQNEVDDVGHQHHGEIVRAPVSVPDQLCHVRLQPALYLCAMEHHDEVGQPVVAAGRLRAKGNSPQGVSGHKATF